MTTIFATIIMFVFLSFSINSVLAAVPSNLPTQESIQNQLNLLNKRSELSAEDKLTIADLEQSLLLLDNIQQLEKKLASYDKTVEQLPEKLRNAQYQLNQLKQKVANKEVGDYQKSLEALPLATLESQLETVLQSLQKAQDDLANYSNELIVLQTQPERAQSVLFNNSERLQQIRISLNKSSADKAQMRPSAVQLLQLEQYYLQQQNNYQKRTLQFNVQLQSLLQLQRDYSSAYIDLSQEHAQLIQEEISDKRLDSSEETAKEAQSTGLENQEINSNPFYLAQTEINKHLSDKLIVTTQNNNELNRHSLMVKNRLDRAIQSERNLKEQIDVLKGSLLLSRILFEEQVDLPDGIFINNLPDKIADLRLEQFEINKQRDQIIQPSVYIDQLMHEYQVAHPEASDPNAQKELRSALELLVDARRELLDKLNNQLGNQISGSINLQMDQQQLRSVVSSLENTLAQQIFWVSSNKPINLNWFSAFPSQAVAEFQGVKLNWSNENLLIGAKKSLPVLIGLILFGSILIWQRKKLDIQFEKLNGDINKLNKDSQLHTPLALGIVFLKTLPLSCFVLAIGYWLINSFNVQQEFIWSFAWQFAVFWLMFEWSYRLMSDNGVAVKHFKIPVERVQQNRKRLLRLSFPMLPIILLSAYGINNPLLLVGDVIGQLVAIISLFCISLCALPFCREMWQEKGNHVVRTVVITLLTFSPLILMGLVIFGYYYTALRLANRWIDSLYLLMLWFIAYHASLRGLTVAARRLAYRRALERRQAMLKEKKEGEDNSLEPIQEPPMDMDLINQQSLRLTTMILFIIFASSFYGIWSDFITVFTYLDGITLWNYTLPTELGNVVKAVTVADLLLSVSIMAISWFMTRNLPGLLEVLILSRIKLQQGASYAITTILTYVIIAIGTIVSLGILGVAWEKLQWLAAALTVGLGFGLQEIFANFVSGLIILFERPVRIGDTVTIGTYSGTVSRIRIRATTVTDFDRKEVIIPNKAFVTERLINWTLSDTVTRIIIQVGVAYGSDLEKVKAILMKAAKDNIRVMTEPEPVVLFTEFGASTLNHELRFYVRTLGDRSIAIDEVNRAIDKLCNENNINIAFNQLDVYLHNKQGDEVQEIKRPLDGSTPDANTPFA
ncbi:mechanosensitive channel MscK [Proteus penneri]|uniref:Mechanosensitive channel MscK n=2 Tax=Morganellaceae TaxID=1903414 RepID=A0ABS0W2R6_9GAMM|nr:mechanosensitive channel MscK [Proteus penneri]NBL91909.1 mechanosensitive channel MscK [Proteus sp. G2673]NBM03255.1 mechanosensitive channel MscK [Proteus sp. G2671]NBM12677.1 mechanosensitive channel MscK [Proteus sp. G2670]NBM34042.1 mechanosensitive channel MscK [Proteus sp. G2664]NBM85652.1 mechanosensitive channel MscK [Proteus sp. G2661]NBM88581.1 mechanosensitive channel MscK [Proteus sp. G2658]NBM93740.1 mechanosensitive channel MscK [Proteus sp. G2662]NBM96601.1 mechanosensiti